MILLWCRDKKIPNDNLIKRQGKNFYTILVIFCVPEIILEASSNKSIYCNGAYYCYNRDSKDALGKHWGKYESSQGANSQLQNSLVQVFCWWQNQSRILEEVCKDTQLQDNGNLTSG